VIDDASVHRLETDTGTLGRLADFINLIDEHNNANNWLMIPLVDRLVSLGIALKQFQCYGYKQLPILGGTYTPDNIVPKTIKEYYPFLGDIYKQIKNLPDGTKVQIDLI
jgi:hypothetical protein